MTFIRTMLEVAESDPGRLALAGDGERVTYAELRETGTRIRSGVEQLLAGRPASASDGETGGAPIVAVSLSRAIDAGRFLAGLASFHAVAAVLDPLWPLADRIATIGRVDPALVITDDAELERALAGLAGWRGTVVPLDRFDALAAAAPVSAGPEVRPRDEPYLLLFTSGTTEAPKGFLRTRGSWDYNVAASRGPLFAGDGVQTIAPGPVSYSLTLYALVEALATGGSLHLQSRFDAADAVRTIERHGVERFVGVPSMLPALAAAARGGDALASLRWVITGGANQSESIRERFREAAPHALLRSYYGASEIGFIGYSDAGDGTRLTPFAGLEAQVRDDAGSPVPDGVLGTLHVRVASQVAGYLTATSHDRITGDDGWSTVGDLASIEGGLIVLAGRAGDMAVTGGHKVSLPQVERALATVPGCESCCAVALPDAALGQLVAVVVEGAAVPAKAVMQAELRRLLPEQFVPRRYYRADALPRTAGGKIRRTAVAELVESGRAERL
ncbi:class I adenylate-forming enzyme family protein [Agrococcus baldri]|uniref:Long-chain-fatty-acid--CoA ligase n=1 Tax=Agrococcus baldri TaxID=153730 RepID=A0AA87USE5_9MICO|nr:AMP-binding protein [Agrococcus baldri]GEK80310.1 long-chain-fatty-acid--CoA ligase [Agrococcus baldri]